MVKSTLAVDTLTIQLQRSLALLEDRYRELCEIGNQWSESWAAEKAALQQQISTLGASLREAQAARDEQAAQLEGFEEELSMLRSELDAFAKSKATTELIAADLQHQLTVQTSALQDAQAARNLQAEQLKNLASELTTLKHQHETLVDRIQHLRHLARLAST